MTALFDGDGLFYIVAYNYKDVEKDLMSIDEVIAAVDSVVTSSFTLVHAKSYHGFLSDPSRMYFRHGILKYNTYKGGRPKDEDWMVRWRPVIYDRLVTKWGFQHKSSLEADDLISYTVEQLVSDSYVICTPDKDMDQCPGWHFDYKKNIGTGEMTKVTTEQAYKTLWRTIISGDLGDNVPGVPKLGEVKAKALLDAANDPIEYGYIAKNAYIKYFGPYYGPIIYEENRACIMMMTTKHPHYKRFSRLLGEIAIRKPLIWDSQKTKIFAK